MDFCDNVFASRLTFPAYYRLLIAIPNLILIPFTVVANGLLLFSIVKTRQYRKTSSLLIFCLGCSDLFMALAAQPSVAVMILKYLNIKNCRLSATSQFLILLGGHLSAMFVIAVSVDRFIHMRYPYSYKEIMTKRRSYCLIVFCIIFPIFIATSYTFATYYQVFVPAHIAFLLTDAIIIMTIFWAYLGTYVQVAYHVNSTQALRTTPCDLNNDAKKTGKRPRYALKAAKTIFLILAAVCICYTPYVTASLIWCGMKLRGKSPGQSFELSLFLTYVLVYLNSGLNAVIFLHGNKACRLFLNSGFKRYATGESLTDTDDRTLRETLEDSNQMKAMSANALTDGGAPLAVSQY